MELIITKRNGEKFKVLYDDRDHEMLSKHKWFISSEGYVATNKRDENGKWRYTAMHRMILGLTDPKDLADHKHGNKADNRRSELRVCNSSQNDMNQKARGGKSKYTGVTVKNVIRKDNTIRVRYCARVCINRRWRYLGMFVKEEDAARVRDAAAKILYGEFARLNFPNE